MTSTPVLFPSHLPEHVALAAVAVVLFVSSAGCGYLAVGVAGTAAASASGGGGAAGTAPPAPPALDLLNTAPSRADLVDGAGSPSATEIAIPYTLSDPTSAPLDLSVEWRRAGEGEAASRAASEASGSDGKTALASSPAGERHKFVWAAGADLAEAGLVEEEVVLRLQPRRADAAGAPKEARLRAGNRAPVPAIDVPEGEQTRTVLTTFTVADSAADSTAVRLEAQARDDAGLAAGATVTVRNLLLAAGSETVVAAIPTGTAEGIVWDSTDADGDAATADDFGFRNVTVSLRLVARDRFGLEGETLTSIRLANDSLPVAQIRSIGFPGKRSRGRVPVTVTVLDPEARLDPARSGRASIAFEFSTDGGGTFATATALSLGEGRRDFGSPTDGRTVGVFPDIAAGTSTFLWDTAADLGATPEGGVPVSLRVTPRNALSGIDAQALDLIENSIAFDLVSSPGTGSQPLGVLALDLTGDGVPDLAVANENSGTVSILKGRGDGQFDLVVPSPAVQSSPGGMAAADLTGDGVPDLAVANRSSSTVSILKGRGDGQFDLVVQSPAVGSSPRAVAARDLTGDGILDLAVASDGSSTVSVLKGRGNGEFDPLPGAPNGPATDLAALDLTNDGIADLALVNAGAQVVTIVKGHGDGGFDLVGSHAVGRGPRAIAALDLDGDGILDLAVANSDSNTVSVLKGQGGGAFALVSTPVVGSNPQDVAAVDLTGDGIPDLAVTNIASNTVAVLRGRGNGQFDVVASVRVGTAPRGIAALDLDQDGIPDLAAANRDSATVSVLRGLGDGQFDRVATPAVAEAPSAIAAADLDQDGVPDLATAGDTGTASVLRGRGDGQFDLVESLVAGANPAGVAAADFDGDGDRDLAVTNQNGGTVSLLRGRGDGRFDPIEDVSVGTSPFGIAALDLTGDAVPDLAVTIQGGVKILKGRGDGRFDIFPTAPAGSSPRPIVALDLDGDGFPDLAVANSGASSLSVLKGLGNGQFNLVASPAVGFSPQGLAGADVTGDGIPDLVASNDGPGTLSVLRGRGDGTFDLVASPAVGTSPRGVAAADFTGDGVPDLAAAALGSDAVTVLRGRSGHPGARGDAGGGWTIFPRLRGISFATNSLPLDLVVLDAAPDGVPDLAVAELAGIAVGVLSFSHGCPSRTLPLATGQAPPSGVAERDLRVVNVGPLDPAAAGEPGLVATPTAGMRLAPAGLAATVSPDTATFAADFTLTLPLGSHLSGRELEGAGGIIHVYRHERDVQGATRTAYRRPIAGRIVEVASTASATARDLDGDGAADVGAATVSATAGTVSFPVSRFGTFHSFIEVPRATVPLLRETFDGARAPDGALAPLPEGWAAGHSWQVGPPPGAGASPAGPDAPPSSPNVLGTNLRGSTVRASGDDAVTTGDIIVGGGIPGDRQIALRYREWVHLGAGDSVSVEVILPGGGVNEVAGAAHAAGFSTPVNAFADAGPFDVTSLVGSSASFKLRFRLRTGASNVGRGWYLDDVDVVIEAR